MNRRNRAIFILFAFLVFLPLISTAAERALEIVYPKIPGVPTPEYVSTELPAFVNYLFRFSVILIGILIFGILIYSGINYLLSFGNPAKLSDAKQGMIAAGFGGVILLGAYIIFNTINPQLLILTPPEVGLLKALIVPGVYLCNYNVPDIGDILIRYMGSDMDIRKEAAERLSEAMGTPGGGGNCFLANASLNLNFVIGANSDKWTIFVVPSEEYNDEEGGYGWTFNHGIILHEEVKQSGRCKIFPNVSAGISALYRQIDASDFHAKLGFDVKSITVFQKPFFEPDPKFKGVTLYEGLAWNEIGKTKVAGKCGEVSECFINEAVTGIRMITWCSNPCGPTQIPTPQCSTWMPWTSTCPCKKVSQCGGTSVVPSRNYISLQKELLSSLLSPFFALAEVDPTLIVYSDKPGSGFDFKEIRLENVKKEGKSLQHNLGSIAIEPKDGYFAVIMGETVRGVDPSGNFIDFFKQCQVQKTSYANLTDGPMGRCGRLCNVSSFVLGRANSSCESCAEAVYIIKGQAY